jgi:hypothetical protein
MLLIAITYDAGCRGSSLVSFNKIVEVYGKYGRHF